MSRTPRASLTIAVLDDQDYAMLCRQRNGLEAFGVFVALVVAGRERLGRKRASRIEGTDALRFDDATPYIATRVHASEKQLSKCLEAFDLVAKETGSEPWVYRDKKNHLVIKSFFKFNTNEGWGGGRDGAGRPPNKNQVDSDSNPSRFGAGAAAASAAEAGTGSGSVAAAAAGETPPPPLPTDDDLLTIRPGRHEHDPADVAAFWAEIWRAFGREPLCLGWYEQQRRHSLAAWKAAFSEAKRRDKPFASVSYVEKIAHDFDDDGRKKPSRNGLPNGQPSAFDPDPNADLNRDREAIMGRKWGSQDA